MSTISHHRRDLLFAREGFSNRDLYTTSAWWQKSNSPCQCCNYTKPLLEMGILVSAFHTRTSHTANPPRVRSCSSIIKKANGYRIVAMVGGFCFTLLFLFVPETFWDRTPRPKSRSGSSKSSFFHRSAWTLRRPSTQNVKEGGLPPQTAGGSVNDYSTHSAAALTSPLVTRPSRTRTNRHVGFASSSSEAEAGYSSLVDPTELTLVDPSAETIKVHTSEQNNDPHNNVLVHETGLQGQLGRSIPDTSGLHSSNSLSDACVEKTGSSHLSQRNSDHGQDQMRDHNAKSIAERARAPDARSNQLIASPSEKLELPSTPQLYTTVLRDGPKQTFIQQLKPFNGRLHNDNWFRVAIRPFILYCYPAVLWSAVVYACSVGWLIVLSESVAEVYRNKDTYNFSALSTGLIYISPFIGGILGTVVAGKVSDVIVKYMSRRNGGLYEPEFRLVMAIPIAITTVIGLMGFGWSVQEHDAWIVPTVFFGIISFGCSLGSTTAITFCVDSYRQYAGEALVTLNFSKNILHGLVFSLFFNSWLASDGPKRVFLAIGGIQLACLSLSIPMYIFGKRARMWTVRKNLMERF